MRPITGLPLCAAILLAACGGGAEDLAADGEVTGEELAAAAADIQMLPGQYRTKAEVIEIDIPGMPAEQAEQMRGMFGAGVSQATEFCLTPEEASEKGAREMLEQMAKSDCSFDRYVVDGSKIDAAMQCKGAGGAASAMTVVGTMGAESSDVTMEMESDAPGVGKVRMKMRAQSERIGDCA